MKKKIVMLGCENSHAGQFMDYINKIDKYSDVEVVGAYSDEADALETFCKKYDLKKMDSCGECAGQADGVVITARSGNNHYRYAEPYIKYGVPMFIDKPITQTEEDALSLARACMDAGVRLTGGSCLKYVDTVKKLKVDAESGMDATLGGFVRTPVMLSSPYGGFFFYAQHLVETVCEIFGRYPNAVYATRNVDCVTVLFEYEKYCVTGLFVDGNWQYYASRTSLAGTEGQSFSVTSSSSCFVDEFDDFYRLLNGAKMSMSYEDFISPVFIMNAIARSLESGNRENVRRFVL